MCSFENNIYILLLANNKNKSSNVYLNMFPCLFPMRPYLTSFKLSNSRQLGRCRQCSAIQTAPDTWQWELWAADDLRSVVPRVSQKIRTILSPCPRRRRPRQFEHCFRRPEIGIYLLCSMSCHRRLTCVSTGDEPSEPNIESRLEDLQNKQDIKQTTGKLPSWQLTNRHHQRYLPSYINTHRHRVMNA